MFFSNSVRSSIASRLRPWLAEEPDLELQLGLLSSHGCAKNLVFDPSVLNPLIEDSSRLEFKGVEVGELRVQLRPWSCPSIHVEVRRLRVTLAPRETSNPEIAISDLAARKKKEVIVSLDPEGASLHDAIERILARDITGDRLMTSWGDVIASCSQIKFSDIAFELQIEKSHACLLEMDDCFINSQFFQGASLFRQFLGSLFLPGKGCGLSVGFNTLRFGLKENDQINWITSLSGLSAHMKLMCFHPLSNYIHVPLIEMKLSPDVIPLLLLMLDTLSSKKHGGIRTGKELWRTTANKIGFLTAEARTSLHNVVEMVVLWSRYVSTYNSLLTVVGRSTEVSFNKNVGMDSINKNIINQARHQLGLIFELEQKLPARMVVQARKIARNKRFDPSTDPKRSVDFSNTLLRKILVPFWFLWRVVWFIFQALSHFSFWKGLNLHCGIQRVATLGDDGSCCISFEEIFITCSHSAHAHFPITKEIGRDAKMNLPSFGLILRQLWLNSRTDESKVSFFMALGEIKLCLVALHAHLDSKLTIKRNHSSKAVHPGSYGESKVILWSDSALLCHPQVTSNDDSLKPFGIILENNIRDLWSNLKKIRGEHEANALHDDEAFLICELKSFLTDPYNKNGGHGLWKYSLNVGKVSLDLDYSSILLAGLIFRQVEDHFQWALRTGRTPTISCTSSIVVDKSRSSMENMLEIYAKEIVVAILSLIPAKNIHVGALVAGFCLRVSLEDRFLGNSEKDITHVIAQGNSCHWIKIDIGNTEFVIWPASKAVLVAMTAESYFEKIPLEYLWLVEPRKLNVHEEGTANEKFISHGCITLNACLRFNVVNASSGFELTKQSHIAEPISITTKASICRDYCHSFYTTTDVLSLAFTAITSSAAVLFFIDELRNIFQLFEGMLLELPVSYNSIGSDDLEGCHKLVRNLRDELCCISTEDGMNLRHTLVLIDTTLELEPVDLILGESRKVPSTGMSVYDDSSSCNVPYLSPSPTKKETSSSDVLELPGFGFGFSIHKSRINLSLESHSVNVLIDLSGLQTVLLDHQSLMRISNDILHIRNIPSESLKHSYQFYLSHCMLKLHISLHCDILCCSNSSCVMHSLHSANCRTSWVIEESHHGDGSPSNTVDGDYEFESGNLHSASIHDQTSGFSFVVDVGFGCIIVSDYHDTSLFNRADEPYESRISIFVGEGLHSINCKIQGGSIFLEALALTKFFRCFLIYYLLIASFPQRIVYASREASVSRLSGNNLATPDLPSSKEHLSGSLTPASSSKTQQTARWDFIDALTIDLTQFSFTVAVASSSGKAKLTIEVDVLLRLTDFGRRIIVDLHRLEVFTQHLHESILNKNEEMQVLHFRSQTSIASGSQNPSEFFFSQDPDCVSSDLFSAHSPSSPTFEHEENNDTSDSFYHRHYLLKHMIGSVTMEKVDLESDRYNMEFDSNWVGKGSISGLNLIIKLSEIQMFLALYALFSETFPVEANNNDMQNVSRRNSAWNADSDYKIPDGAIIAIQDLQQHMYFAVEAVDNKYHLVGTLHYFLSGERALFKVRYHKSWRSRIPCMSFISLYAKNNKGEPLCLNFNPRSGFVGISGTDGNGSSLWQTIFHEFDNFEDEDDDVKTYATSRKAFHMVNLKNDSAVAFIDGMPEFVKKPGNQFKVKLFDGSLLVNGFAGYTFKSSSDNGCDKHLKGESSVSGGGRSEFYSNLPHVNFTLDKVTLTIVHDVSNVDDQLPLFRCCLDNVALLGQILSTKLRILSLFSAVLHHFDARMNIWREVVAPVDLWLFYRSRFTQADSFIGDHGVPVHFFLRMSLVDISLTEISLDILLYLINKLDLAGPYAVRRSVIFPNSCKLENCTGLSALYQFSKNQKFVLSREQSSSVFLRSAALADRLPVSESSVSISLSDGGGISTSPINISLSNPCLFAWRTHIVSSKDSKTFPGPFVVIDVTKKDEEGLSVIVSPLLRIHNDSKFPMELCFQRPEEAKSESASILLNNGDSVDDSRAVFDALDFYGGSKRTLLSLTLGNFLLSLKPQITEYLGNNEKNICFCWSEEIKGGKAQRVSGIFDKLNYRFRKALGVGSLKSFFSTLCCPITIEGQHASDLHFLIQTISRDVPIMKPQNVGNTKEARSSLVAMQVQKEIFIYPTVQVYNLLQSEIFVLLSENHPDMCIMEEASNFGRQATIPSQSSAYLFANPTNIYFRITLNAYGSTSKPVNSGDWVKKLEKKRTDAHFIDIELEFGGGTYFATFRLSCSDRGILEATIFTTYTLQNSSEITLFCSASSQISCSGDVETEIYSSDIPPESGCLLPPKSTKSWFLKPTKVYVKWLKEKTSMALVDLDILTAFIELSLEAVDDAGINRVAKLGVSLQPCVHKEVFVPMHVVSFVPRFVIVNESKESIVVRQCYLQDDVSGDTIVEARQKVPLHIRSKGNKKREKNIFDSVFRRHSSKSEDTQIFVQFCTKEDASQSWSGPICIASLGRFFLKFKGHSVYHTGSSNLINLQEKKSTQFAAAYIVDDRSSLILYFHMPPDIPPPYRIENFLQGASIKYYQKDSAEPEILPSGASTEYVWDDLSLPHRLVVEILDFHLMREINIDKICEWKPFFKTRRHGGFLLHFPLNKQSKIEQRTSDEPHGIDIFKLGFEVYADGSTRVLRLCESTRRKEQNVVQPSTNFQLRLSSFAVHFLKNKQVEDFSTSEPLNYVTIVVARLRNITLDSLIARRCKYNNLKVQSFTVDEKWQGAPFASMVRRSQLHDSEMNMNILHFIFILQSTNSKVKQVKYCSIVLQPIDLKIDEETLMKLVPFWRSSNNYSVKQSQQFYFKHFEIHPVKITASFLPGNQYPGYNSTQQALRSLLHSVLKVPSISNVVLELNGVLLTHALVTSRELLIKCAQHYSWYLIRAVYIAKGSSLLPPAFASIFDDTASYSLDVFFDPSDGSISLPGLTLGMFKIISKCIHAKDFSGTRRYFGDLGKTIKTAGSNVIFAAVTEISDNVLRGAESSGFNGLVTGFHQGILRLAMEPSLLGTAVMMGGPDRKIKLDRSPGVDELYIEGYLQAMLDVMYKQEYLRVRVIDNQVLLKNLPPNSSVINEILENVKSFLVSNALLKGDTSTSSRPLRCLKSENDWKLGPTVLTLCEHLFVSFTVRMLRKHANKFITGIKLKGKEEAKLEGESSQDGNQQKASRTWAVGKFFFSGMIAYVDGRLCRHIPHPLVRRIVSGFMLSYLDKSNGD